MHLHLCVCLSLFSFPWHFLSINLVQCSALGEKIDSFPRRKGQTLMYGSCINFQSNFFSQVKAINNIVYGKLTIIGRV